ncbi:MAG: hypothetical protein WC750_00565 [Patescibacteria group bacterium]|jgi:di/tripeptidase
MEKSKVLQRFLEYVQIDTRSVRPESEEKRVRPSSNGQLDLGMKIIGALEG